MSRLSGVPVHNFVRLCPGFCAFIRFSCFHGHTFVLSPDFRALMPRLSFVHVQTFVRSSDFRAFMARLLCFHQTFVRSWATFVRSCPDFLAFMSRFSMHSCPNFRAFLFRQLRVHQNFVRSCPDFCALLFRFFAFTRLSCVHVQSFVPSCPNFRAFMSKLSCVHD